MSLSDGNTDCYTEIFLGMREQLLHVVGRIAPSKDSEDIVQETYLRLCQLPAHERLRAPRSFIFKTARNLALDHIKRAENRLAVSIGHEEGYPPRSDGSRVAEVADPTFAGVVSSRELAMFARALRRLSGNSRRAFIMKKVFGHSQREIAEQLGLSESTVEKHIAAGARRCAHLRGSADE